LLGAIVWLPPKISFDERLTSVYIENGGGCFIGIGKAFSMGSKSLALKKWGPCFGMHTVRSSLHLIYMKLLGLSLKFWSIDVLRMFGNNDRKSLEENDSIYHSNTCMILPIRMWSIDKKQGDQSCINVEIWVQIPTWVCL